MDNPRENQSLKRRGFFERAGDFIFQKEMRAPNRFIKFKLLMFFRDNCVFLLPIPNPLSPSSSLLHNLSAALYLSVTHFSLTHLPTPSAQPVHRKSSIHTIDSSISHGSEGPSVEHLITKQGTTTDGPRQVEAERKRENDIGSESAALPPFGIDAVERSRRLQDLKERRIREWKVVMDVRNRQSNRLLY